MITEPFSLVHDCQGYHWISKSVCALYCHYWGSCGQIGLRLQCWAFAWKYYLKTSVIPLWKELSTLQQIPAGAKASYLTIVLRGTAHVAVQVCSEVKWIVSVVHLCCEKLIHFAVFIWYQLFILISIQQHCFKLFGEICNLLISFWSPFMFEYG